MGNHCDGAISTDNQIIGTYLHGLFDHPQACAALLSWAGLEAPEAFDYQEFREYQIDLMADTLEANLDLKELFHILDATTCGVAV
jgi:adenosylcobyric acid synthase